MIVSFFKSNHQFLIAFVLLLGAALWLPSFLNPIAIPKPAPTEILYFPLYNFFSIFHPKILTFVAFLLLFLQSIVLNNLIINHTLIEKNTFIPAVVYFVIMSIFPQHCTLHPVHFSNLMLLVYLNVIFRYNLSNEPVHQVFLLSSGVGILSLIFNPSLFVMPVIWLSFIIYNFRGWRMWAVSVMGLALPLIFVVFFFFFFDKIDFLTVYKQFFKPALPLMDFKNIHFISKVILFSFVFFAAIKYTSYTRERIVMLRKFASVLFVAFLSFFVAYFVFGANNLLNVLPAFIPASIFITHLLLSYKKAWVPELIFVFMLIIFIFFRLNIFL